METIVVAVIGTVGTFVGTLIAGFIAHRREMKKIRYNHELQLQNDDREKLRQEREKLNEQFMKKQREQEEKQEKEAEKQRQQQQEEQKRMREQEIELINIKKAEQEKLAIKNNLNTGLYLQLTESLEILLRHLNEINVLSVEKRQKSYLDVYNDQIYNSIILLLAALSLSERQIKYQEMEVFNIKDILLTKNIDSYMVTNLFKKTIKDLERYITEEVCHYKCINSIKTYGNYAIANRNDWFNEEKTQNNVFISDQEFRLLCLWDKETFDYSDQSNKAKLYRDGRQLFLEFFFIRDGDAMKVMTLIKLLKKFKMLLSNNSDEKIESDSDDEKDEKDENSDRDDEDDGENSDIEYDLHHNDEEKLSETDIDANESDKLLSPL